ncbi:UDP-2,4-diacetamido-2,4,6-trideoxy-beta-L-altropyranose hydrolase [Alteromonas sp. 14N.309.X.WAT.G.H12]|uniref:UDP-2,4-diacetamido-2,4, 6-trideoxy-beta-L-altropyranose hydrolase n=1 Tax=Alteromonas sp. 14N.309.X.WAT.G.H12 TaxID=3120824 RepID=UPI002FD55366
MRPVLFRVNVSPTIGMGHLMRSLALAQAAESYDIPCHFIVDAGSKALAVSRHDWVYPVVECAQSRQSDEADFIANYAQSINASVVVVDGYAIEPNAVALCRQQGTPVVVMDDGQLTQVRVADIIVNSTSSALDEEYQRLQPKAVLCTGAKYRLMRREFQVGTPPGFAQRHGIVLCLGGSDPKKLTIPLVRALDTVLDNTPLRVVTGAAFKDTAALQQVIGESDLPIQHVHNCQDMADVWRNAKLAISAAGGSQFELGVCETPSVLLMVAENQRLATLQAQQEGWCQAFDCIEHAPLDAIADTVKQLWQSAEALNVMHNALKNKYRADGAYHVLDAIAKVINR